MFQCCYYHCVKGDVYGIMYILTREGNKQAIWTSYNDKIWINIDRVVLIKFDSIDNQVIAIIL